MVRRSLRGLAIGAALALSIAISGCATSSTASIEIGPETVLVDVRTPGEFAGGHLAGAVNIDRQSATFDSAIAQLDPNGEYVVYCQSGNRSAQAVAVMQAAGLDVQDAGGIAEAAQATDLDIVR